MMQGRAQEPIDQRIGAAIFQIQRALLLLLPLTVLLSYAVWHRHSSLELNCVFGPDGASRIAFVQLSLAFLLFPAAILAHLILQASWRYLNK